MKWATTSAKKIVLGAASILAVAALGVLFFAPQPAQAATLRWVNRFHIQVDNKYFFDTNTYDNVYEYVEQGATDNCADKVVFTPTRPSDPNSNQADSDNLSFYYSNSTYSASSVWQKRLVTRTSAQNTAGQQICNEQSENVNPSDIDNRRVLFYERKDNKKIQHIATGLLFTQRGEYPPGSSYTRYFRDDEVTANEKCADMIIRHPARVLDGDRLFGTSGDVPGSSLLFAVDDRSGLGRISESYWANGQRSDISRSTCRVDPATVNTKKSGNTYGLAGYGDDDLDAQLLAAGIDSNGQSSNGGDYPDDAFIIFIGTEDANMPKNTDGSTNNTPTNAPGSQQVGNQTCKGGALGWVICPIVSAIQSTADLLKEAMQALLAVNPLPLDTNAPIYQIWNNIRNFANIAFVLAFFIVIFSQATSIGISNYGIKRMIPNLVAAAILANLSYFICSILIDAFNILGVGVYNMVAIVNGGEQGTVDVSNGAGAVLVGLATVGTAAAFYTAAVVQLFPLLAVAFIGMVITFLILLFRQAVLIVLVAISPFLAIGKLRIIPGLEKPADQGIGIFVALLVMYPLIMLLFAGARLVGSMLSAVGGSGLMGTSMDVIALILQIVIGFAAIFLFKWAIVAKGALGRLAGVLNDKTKGLTNKAEEFGKNRRFYQRRQLAKENRQRERQRGAVNDYARALQRSGWRGRALQRRAGGTFNTLGQQRAIADVHSVIDKQFTEDKQRARAMMSLNAARAFADAGTDQARLQSIINNTGSYKTSKGKVIGFSSQDQEAISNLHRAGFLNGHDNRAGAAAALDELFDQQFIEKPDIDNLAKVAGTDAESAGLMTKTVSEAAARNKYKNFTYGAIESNSGNYIQYQVAPGTKDGLRIVESGVAGTPKEIFDDASILAGLAHKTRDASLADPSSIIDVARQTMAVDKEATIKDIASAIGLDPKTFVELRQAIQTNTLDSSGVKSRLTVKPVRDRPDDIKKELKATLAKRRSVGDYVPPATRAAGTSDPLDYINSL